MSDDFAQDSLRALDAEIAEARAQWRRIEEKAAAGDPMAKLLVKRFKAAEAKVLETFAANLFGGRETE